MATTIQQVSRDGRFRVFRGAHRATTIGIVLVITLVAFEAMAVATAMPFAVRDLHGLAYYSWAFTAFTVASVVGIVLSGDMGDRLGAARPLLGGLGVFIVGLLVAGTAPVMAVFVAGRAVQGFGAGLVIVAVYVVVAEAYAEDLRPQVFAALSAAWVLPSVLGPAIAGLLTAHLTWRLVFLGLPPFVVVGAVFLLPTLRRLPVRPATRAGATGRVALAAAAAVGVGALQIAGQQPRLLSVLPAVVGVVLLAVGLPRLLPRGTARLSVGLPAVVGLRGLLAGAFFGADAFLPLTLTTVHGFRAEHAGIPLTLSALGWSAGSWWQGHREREDRRSLLRAGFAAVAVAVLGLAVVARPEFTGWLAAPVWVIGGVGMGLAMPTISVLTLKFAPPGEQGFASSALQISDVLGSSICIGFAGVLLTSFSRAGTSMPTAIGVINVVLVLIALTGLVAAGRARARAATLDRQ